MKNMITQKLGSLLGILAVAFIGVTLASTSVNAQLAAGTSIDNVATVTFDEGTAPPSNTVSTIVNLVSGLAWDDITLNPTTQTTSELTPLSSSYTVELINLGSGATTAVVTNTTTESTGDLGVGIWTINGGVSASIPLGGTLSYAAGVPNGGNTDITITNSASSGLAIGETVSINGGTANYTIANITATTLTITGDVTALVNAAGIQIGEVTTVTFAGTTGDLNTLNSLSETHLHAMLATDELGGAGGNSGNNADGNPAATDTINSDGGVNPWETDVVAGALTIQKFVRNMDDINDNIAGLTTPVDVNAASPYGTSHFQSGITGDAGETLEYLIVITNAGPGNATNVVVSDTITAYLAFTPGTVDIDADGDGTFEIVNAEASNAAAFSALVLTAYPGVGGSAVGPTIGGDVDFDLTPTTAIRFQTVIQ